MHTRSFFALHSVIIAAALDYPRFTLFLNNRDGSRKNPWSPCTEYGNDDYFKWAKMYVNMLKDVVGGKVLDRVANAAVKMLALNIRIGGMRLETPPRAWDGSLGVECQQAGILC